MQEDEEAIQYLKNNDGKSWAATAEMVNGSETAPLWLQKFFPVFGALADALIAVQPTGGHNSGGFGGGRFGGGGGGGKW